jgi:hypothetical protein
MENHHFSWENSLYMVIFISYVILQRVMVGTSSGSFGIPRHPSAWPQRDQEPRWIAMDCAHAATMSLVCVAAVGSHNMKSTFPLFGIFIGNMKKRTIWKFMWFQICGSTSKFDPQCPRLDGLYRELHCYPYFWPELWGSNW